MRWLEVLLEGAADVPVVREVLVRRFGLVEGEHFRLHPHRGKGELPTDILGPPPLHKRGLLDQLPAKLRGFAYLGSDASVVVLVDADRESCVDLLARLHGMLRRLPRRPASVLFRIAIEETESWFIADQSAVVAAYPRARLSRLRRVAPDAICGAWEVLAESLGVSARDVSGVTKIEWAQRIAPRLDLTAPPSPSLQRFVEGLARVLGQ